MALDAGTPAPEMTLKTLGEDGLADLNLQRNKGKGNTVLLFVPAAFTGVCTEELCTISQAIHSYQNMNADVIGISADTPFAQAEWAKQENITIPLASDYSHKAIEAFDVVLDDLAGLGPGSKRAVFVLDKDGVIRHSQAVMPNEMPDFDAVEQALQQLN